MKLNSNRLKTIGMALTVITAVVTVVATVVSKEQQKLSIIDAVNEAVDAKFNSLK